MNERTKILTAEIIKECAKFETKMHDTKLVDSYNQKACMQDLVRESATNPTKNLTK